MIAVPLLGKRSDGIGYRRVLLICLAGATLTSLPQAFADSYWVFTVERFGVGLFIGGILPTANALIGRMVSRSRARRGLRHDRIGDLPRQLAGPADRRRDRGSFGLRWVFLITAALLLANLVWVYFTVPEYVDERERIAEAMSSR